jgi:ElaB/YqjD/DUF883 family membrane-anchored ribosome-binding protein
MSRPDFDRVLANLDTVLAEEPAPLIDDATVRTMVAAHIPTREQDAAALDASTRRLLDALAEDDEYVTDHQPLSALALGIAAAALLGLLTLAAALYGAARLTLRSRP